MRKASTWRILLRFAGYTNEPAKIPAANDCKVVGNTCVRLGYKCSRVLLCARVFWLSYAIPVFQQNCSMPEK